VAKGILSVVDVGFARLGSTNLDRFVLVMPENKVHFTSQKLGGKQQQQKIGCAEPCRSVA